MLYQCVLIFLSSAFINCAPVTDDWVGSLKDLVNIPPIPVQNNATKPAVNTTVSNQAKAYPYPDQYVVQPTYTTQQTYVPQQTYITQPAYTQPTYTTQQTYVTQPSYVTQQTYAQPTQTYAQPTQQVYAQPAQQVYTQPTQQVYTQPTQQVLVTQPYNREFVNFDGTPYVPTTVYPTTTTTGGAVAYPQYNTAGYATPVYPTAAVNPYDPSIYAYAAYPTYASPYGYGAPIPAPSPYGNTSPYQSYPPHYGSASHYQQHGSSSYS